MSFRLSAMSATSALAVSAAIIVHGPAANAQTAPTAIPKVSGNLSDEMRNRAPEISEVVVTASRAASVATVSPTQNTLTATEPRSIIGQDFISNMVSPASDFEGIVAIAPSVTLNSPAGVGIAESKNLQIRGFQDGQFNVTYDALPFGDSNDNSHHSNSYFPASNIGEIAVDRGPGTAGTIGNATFGGTIALFSPSTTPFAYIRPAFTYGSFNTRLESLAVDSGTSNLLGTNVLASVQNLTSDGAVSNAFSRQTNGFLKTETPIGEHTVVTFVSSITDLKYAVPGGQTLAQTAAYGKDFGLSSSQSKFTYYGYNTQRHYTDFEYVGLNSDLGALHIDNKLYTFAYRNTGPTGKDLTDTTALGLKGLGAADVYGTTKLNAYRGIGDTLHLAYELPWATLRTGVWVNDTQSNRWQYNIDFTQNSAYCTNAAKVNSLGLCYNYNMRYNDLTTQPFVDADIRLIPNVTITPGVKYTDITRRLAETVDPTTLAPFKNNVDYNATLPFLTVRYEPVPFASAYVQYAQGFQAPPIAVVYGGPSNSNTIQPQKTSNYQAGGVVRLPKLVLDADVYYIEFNNFIQATPDPVQPLETDYANAGGVVYKGIEGSATYALFHGISLYANGSVNSAKYDSSTKVNAGKWVSNAPDSTGALGVIYAEGPWRASVIGKYIGEQYRDSATKDPTTGVALAQGFKIAGYTTANLRASYTYHNINLAPEGVKLAVGIDNLTQDRSITDIKGGKSAPLNLYSYNAERNYFVSLSAAF